MAITQTYLYPVAGTTPPTVAQALSVNAVICRINYSGDTDTSALVTHNFGVTQPQVPNTLSGTPPTYTAAPGLSAGLGLSTVFPLVTVTLDSTTAGTVYPIVSVALTNSVAATVAKISAPGSACTVVVVIQRPWSATV